MTNGTTPVDDDERVPMTNEERGVLVYLVVVVLTSGGYLGLIGYRLLDRPAAEVSWVPALLWTLGVSIGATILATVAAQVVDAIRASGRGVPGCPTPLADQRDREIERVGAVRLLSVLGPGLAVIIVLAMLDADTFWIGNAAFVIGAAGAVVESVTRIRAYRRGL